MPKEDLVSKIYDELRAQILTYRLSPGVKISDMEVARKMGISRTPVREALNRLSEKGLVIIKHNRGFTVSTLTLKDINDIYTLREVLEGLSVKLAMERADKELIKKLNDVHGKFRDLMEKDDIIGLQDLDEKFHDLIVIYSGNELLMQNLRNLHDRVRIARRYTYGRVSGLKDTYAGHGKVLEQMVAGNSAMAVKAMQRHIRNAKKYLMEILKKSEFA
ncbi:MAG: GntR family transcriptional regulator [Desulfarculaceae bacterium]|jgi:DNA-binding GntR family transcriptional regulator